MSQDETFFGPKKFTSLIEAGVIKPNETMIVMEIGSRFMVDDNQKLIPEGAMGDFSFSPHDVLHEKGWQIEE